jgi:hypothetical protein
VFVRRRHSQSEVQEFLIAALAVFVRSTHTTAQQRRRLRHCEHGRRTSTVRGQSGLRFHASFLGDLQGLL